MASYCNFFQPSDVYANSPTQPPTPQYKGGGGAVRMEQSLGWVIVTCTLEYYKAVNLLMDSLAFDKLFKMRLIVTLRFIASLSARSPHLSSKGKLESVLNKGYNRNLTKFDNFLFLAKLDNFLIKWLYGILLMTSYLATLPTDPHQTLPNSIY